MTGPYREAAVGERDPRPGEYITQDLGCGEDTYLCWPEGGGLVSMGAKVYSFIAHRKKGKGKMGKLDLTGPLPVPSDEISVALPFVDRDAIVHAGARLGPNVVLKGNTVLHSNACVGGFLEESTFREVKFRPTTGQITLCNVQADLPSLDGVAGNHPKPVQIYGEGQITLKDGAFLDDESIIAGNKEKIFLSGMTRMPESGKVGEECIIAFLEDDRCNLVLHGDYILSKSGSSKSGSLVQLCGLVHHSVNDERGGHKRHTAALAILTLIEPNIAPFLATQDLVAINDYFNSLKRTSKDLVECFNFHSMDGVAQFLAAHPINSKEPRYPRQRELANRLVSMCPNINNLLERVDQTRKTTLEEQISRGRTYNPPLPAPAPKPGFLTRAWHALNPSAKYNETKGAKKGKE